MTILNGWKEISKYLGRGVRTVQRWERLGLPVHRPRGRPRGAVSALEHELEEWLAATPKGDVSVASLLAEVQRLEAENTALRSQMQAEPPLAARRRAANE